MNKGKNQKVYCKNCAFKNNRSHTVGITYHPKYTGAFGSKIVKSVKGCGCERIEVIETEDTISMIPKRNEDNQCKWYKRKWWKLWV